MSDVRVDANTELLTNPTTMTAFLKFISALALISLRPHTLLPPRLQLGMRKHLSLTRVLWISALLLGVSPLWLAHHLPMVDLPQHLHLISVLHRLNDATTLYPEFFARRPELTPYVGYYYLVSGLNWLMPLDAANRVFLSVYVVGFPLALAFLLHSLKRPTWVALLAIPFAYGDSFAWGFINYISALPLTLLACGLFVRSLEEPRKRAWIAGIAVSTVAVLLFHVQAFAYLAAALPFLLITTQVPGHEGPWKPRVPAVLGVIPSVVLFIIWVGLRLGAPSEVAPGEPWKAWGPMLSEQNLAWKTFEQNQTELFSGLAENILGAQSERHRPALVSVLANMFRDQSDLPGIQAVGLVALLALGAGLIALLSKDKSPQLKPLEIISNTRIVGLALIALALYFWLPFDIRGYMYYLNTRYAHLAAPLVLACVPRLSQKLERALLVMAVIATGFASVNLGRGFAAFDREASQIEGLLPYTSAKPKVMGLMYGGGTSSQVLTHPVYLHASTFLARAQGGITNFSFALTPHSPLMYRNAAPPTFPSEWRPDQMNWELQGSYYDHFVVRGAHPQRVFGQLLQSELTIAGQSGDFYLVKKR